MSKLLTGKIGEQYAANYLLSKAYQIVSTNYHSRYGEVDLIVLKEKVLVFVEVKTRKSNYFGLPQESVTPRKLQRIIKTAIHFLNQSRKKSFHSWRIDLIAIELAEKGRVENILHLKNISYG
jgi:putative endonuclease